ncbi:14642_t:CDS:2 [Funneliformis caledonium]|uniref:14642_t:CDS:1 n=1 Tax=Funneliformis caledonium TaxID=1117310 RepID=A0A9N9GQW1_9GLOM|nr:14642_t:CDS:2 [Funneliformis caledonium]
MSPVISKILDKLELSEEELGDKLVEESCKLVSDSLIIHDFSVNFILNFSDLRSNRRIDFYITSREFIGDFLFENHPHGNDPINIAKITNEKIADKAKNGILPEELNNVKLVMM